MARWSGCCPAAEAQSVGRRIAIPMEALSLFAEVAIGLAGFSGIAVVLSRSPGEWSFADSLRVRMLLGASFGALFASLVPVALLWGGVAEGVAIKSGSCVVFFVFLYWMVRGRSAIRGQSRAQTSVFDPRIARIVSIMFVVGQVSQVVNTLIPYNGSTRIGLAFGILLLLGWAAFGLVRLLFVRPAADPAA